MKLKLIVVVSEDALPERAIETARANGATGTTVIAGARGEGRTPAATFLGLTVGGQRDVSLFLVEEHRNPRILEAIGRACGFDRRPGTGTAFQIDIEDAVGLRGQIESILQDIREEEL